MAKIFGYYDDWKSARLTCPRCGWTGTFEQGAREFYKELMDCSCPTCDGDDVPMLAIVNYPTLEETEANRSKLSESEKKALDDRKRFLKSWEAARLWSDNELPDLEGSALTITWDLDNSKPDLFTTLSHKGREIWRELALWEGFDRFEEVVGILRDRYGSRLADVIPEGEGWVFLMGDDLDASDKVEAIRKSLRRAHRASRRRARR
jgi:hypothetical protein